MPVLEHLNNKNILKLSLLLQKKKST